MSEDRLALLVGFRAPYILVEILPSVVHSAISDALRCSGAESVLGLLPSDVQCQIARQGRHHDALSRLCCCSTMIAWRVVQPCVGVRPNCTEMH